MTLLKSPSTGLVQLRFTCELPAVAVAPVTLPGERLSMVTVVPALSLPAVLLLLGLKPLMRAVSAYLAPGGAATLAWVLGVMRILYVVVVVVAVKVLVLSVMVGVLVAGLVTEPYTVVPALLVISILLMPTSVPVARVTVTLETLSLLPSVTKVKASAMVAAPDGARVVPAGSLPLPSVVVLLPKPPPPQAYAAVDVTTEATSKISNTDRTASTFAQSTLRTGRRSSRVPRAIECMCASRDFIIAPAAGCRPSRTAARTSCAPANKATDWRSAKPKNPDRRSPAGYNPRCSSCWWRCCGPARLRSNNRLVARARRAARCRARPHPICGRGRNASRARSDPNSCRRSCRPVCR